MADEALTAGAVARRLGVAVTTLRTWHQRYGLGPSRHVPGQHRRYTPQDMDRLAGDAPAHRPGRRTGRGRGMGPPGAGPDRRRTRRPAPRPPTCRVPRARRRRPHHPDRPRRPAARGLARAAMRLDGPALRDILEMTSTDRGVVGAWERGDHAGADRHRRAIRGHQALHRGRAPALPQRHRGAERRCPRPSRAAPGAARRRRRGAAHAAAGGAGRRAGRAGRADPAAGRPGAAAARWATRSPVPARPRWWSGRRPRTPATRPS